MSVRGKGNTGNIVGREKEVGRYGDWDYFRICN
jgi:hypothetical protein